MICKKFKAISTYFDISAVEIGRAGVFELDQLMMRNAAAFRVVLS
jgi:hypothetical protein